MKSEVNIQPERLIWAIERAGMDVTEFEIKNPKVSSWIKKEKKPTFKQLQDFSKKVHVPFGYLFFPEPPVEEIPFPFFRSINKNPKSVSLNVRDTINILQKRQDWLRDYLIDGGYEKLDFVGKFDKNDPSQKIVDDLRNTLNLSRNWGSFHATLDIAVNHLVKIIEDLGIIVVFNGVVENNTHRPIEIEECRGFVLVDDYAPFLFVNSKDGKAAQLFTIIHELAHVWLGKSAGFDMEKLLPADDPIERLCDEIAAEFLVPKDIFMEIWSSTKDINILMKYFKVSKIVIWRRALDLGEISKKQFFEFYDEYKQTEFLRREKLGDGGNFFATAKKRVSQVFANHINNAVESGQLLHREAYNLTSLYGDTYANFFLTNK